MQCLVCGGEMRVVKIEPHVIPVRGFEFRTFQCVGCSDLEKRQVFDHGRSAQSAVPAPPAAVRAAPPALTGKMRSILGSLVRLRAAPAPATKLYLGPTGSLPEPSALTSTATAGTVRSPRGSASSPLAGTARRARHSLQSRH